jgi:hypothetical protein
MEEGVVPPTNNNLSLLEIEQQQQNHAEVPQVNEPEIVCISKPRYIYCLAYFGIVSFVLQ